MEHFLVALEPATVSVSTPVAAFCCKISCSASAQKIVNKYVSQVVSNLQAVFMCFFPLERDSDQYCIDLRHFQQTVIPENKVADILSQYGKYQDGGNITLLAISYQTDLNEQRVKSMASFSKFASRLL